MLLAEDPSYSMMLSVGLVKVTPSALTATQRKLAVVFAGPEQP